jgi:transcription elongation factor GreB
VSKAFTKDEVEVGSELVRPRAPLPPGVPNYVTPAGLAALRVELAELLHARSEFLRGGDGVERARGSGALGERILELEARIGSAELVIAPVPPPDDVRFGATVTVSADEGAERKYQLVGVDEADAPAGKIAFLSPVARALLGKRRGDVAVVRTPRGDEELEILAVDYG